MAAYICSPDTISVAQMAKLVDALCSGRSARKGVLVRIQFWAHKMDKSKIASVCPFLFSGKPASMLCIGLNGFVQSSGSIMASIKNEFFGENRTNNLPLLLHISVFIKLLKSYKGFYRIVQQGFYIVCIFCDIH